jgi:DNA polymerase/3'-5' exonuclease PolX
MNNETIARQLTEYANELGHQPGNLYRLRAYRQAVLTIQGLDRPLADLLAEAGVAGLAALPGIGSHLAFTIEHLLRTGEFLTHDEGVARGLLPRGRARRQAPAA